MKTTLSILLCSLSLFCFGQHDFDSLYKNSEAFQKALGENLSMEDFYAFDAPILKLTLQSDYKNLNKEKQNSEYQKAVAFIQINDTVQLETNLKIKARGVMRKELCNFPPLKLNFPKKKMPWVDLQKFDKMKMVRNCKSGERYENYILSEYLIYKMYNLLTDYSFKVRLLQVTYEDTSNKFETETVYAFLIEPEEQMSARLNSLPLNLMKLSSKHLNKEEETTMSVFQYMIGNTDWSLAGLHNVKLIKSKDFNVLEPVAIPYDFDYAGFINTNYAVPMEGAEIEKVTERWFMGVCRSEEEFLATFNSFKAKKEEFYSLINGFEYLPLKTRESQIKYLDRFYRDLESKYKLRNHFMGDCRK